MPTKPSASEVYDVGDHGNFISFCDSFRYLGTQITFVLEESSDIYTQSRVATEAFIAILQVPSMDGKSRIRTSLAGISHPEMMGYRMGHVGSPRPVLHAAEHSVAQLQQIATQFQMGAAGLPAVVKVLFRRGFQGLLKQRRVYQTA
jgi:hypothetical protein